MKRCALLFSIALAIGSVAPVLSGATPGAYPLVCSGGELSLAKVAIGARVYSLLTEPSTDAKSANLAICGWRTRAWPAGQAKALCFSPAVLSTITRSGLGEIETKGPPIDSGSNTVNLYDKVAFATSRYAHGCLNVTAVRAYDAEGPQTTLVCHDAIVADMHAEPIALGNQRPFPIKAGKPPASALSTGSCYALGADPNALPPSRLLCIDEIFLVGKSNHFDNSYPGTYEIRVSPWWPCGLASRVK